jgi:adenosylcobyric acid synthase
VNRFRGNKDLLADAHNYTLSHTGKPVLGVVPYFHDLGLPEEDSVSFKNGLFNDSTAHDDSVEIAIIDLPHISNFTDFDALRAEPDVALKIVKSPSDLNQPDAIILPGSKNTIGDLTYLQNTGIQDRLKQMAEQGVELVGVCGGFQMLGRGISDPHCLESDGKTFQGLGFLDVTTMLAPEKTLTRATCAHIESGLLVHGYEIHHGKSSGVNVEPVLRMGSGSIDGVKSGDGKIWGTYLHGIFDADEFRRWFIDRLRERRGLEPKRKVMAIYDLEPALDRLADAVRKSLDMERICGIIGL